MHIACISSPAFATEVYQIVVCPSQCNAEERKNFAISNRYSRTSEVTIIDQTNWSANTFRVTDFSEPGLTLIEVWEIENPIDVTEALEELKQIDNQFVHTSQYAINEAGYSPSTFTVAHQPYGKTGASMYTYIVSKDLVPSVSNVMLNEGADYDVAFKLRTKFIFPALKSALASAIFNKAKPLTVTVIFSDQSTILYTFDGSLSSLAFRKIDATAQKDGKKFNLQTQSFSSDLAGGTIDTGGNTSYTIFYECRAYTKTSSGGGKWQGRVCYPLYKA